MKNMGWKNNLLYGGGITIVIGLVAFLGWCANPHPSPGGTATWTATVSPTTPVATSTSRPSSPVPLSTVLVPTPTMTQIMPTPQPVSTSTPVPLSPSATSTTPPIVSTTTSTPVVTMGKTGRPQTNYDPTWEEVALWVGISLIALGGFGAWRGRNR